MAKRKKKIKISDLTPAQRTALDAYDHHRPLTRGQKVSLARLLPKLNRSKPDWEQYDALVEAEVASATTAPTVHAVTAGEGAPIPVPVDALPTPAAVTAVYTSPMTGQVFSSFEEWQAHVSSPEFQRWLRAQREVIPALPRVPGDLAQLADAAAELKISAEIDRRRLVEKRIPAAEAAVERAEQEWQRAGEQYAFAQAALERAKETAQAEDDYQAQVELRKARGKLDKALKKLISARQTLQKREDELERLKNTKEWLDKVGLT